MENFHADIDLDMSAFIQFKKKTKKLKSISIIFLQKKKAILVGEIKYIDKKNARMHTVRKTF